MNRPSIDSISRMCLGRNDIEGLAWNDMGGRLCHGCLQALAGMSSPHWPCGQRQGVYTYRGRHIKVQPHEPIFYRFYAHARASAGMT